MGWYNSHLHMFRIYNESYSIPYDEDHLVELDAHDSRRVKLSKLIAAEGEKFAYDYGTAGSRYPGDRRVSALQGCAVPLSRSAEKLVQIP